GAAGRAAGAGGGRPTGPRRAPRHKPRAGRRAAGRPEKGIDVVNGLSRRSFLGSTAVLGGATVMGSAMDAGRAAVAAEPASAGCAPPFGPVSVALDDPRYADLVRGFNQRFVGQPDYVVVAGSTRQVVDAVQAAVSAGKRVAVRSGGHCYEDFVASPDVQVVIDLSQLRAVY